MTVDNRTYSALHCHSDLSNVRLLDAINTIADVMTHLII